jgi:preprotein translocase subunit SecD
MTKVRAVHIAILLICVFCFPPFSKSQSLVEIRIVADPLYKYAVRMVNEQTHAQTALRPRALLSLRDLSSARALVDSSNPEPMYVLRLQFRSEVKDSLRRVMEANVNNRMGIIIDGQLKATPLIVRPVASGMIALFLPTYKEACTIASKINRALGRN